MKDCNELSGVAFVTYNCVLLKKKQFYLFIFCCGNALPN